MPPQHPAALPAVPRPLPAPPRKPIADRIVDLADVSRRATCRCCSARTCCKAIPTGSPGQTGLGKSTLLFNIACALAEGNSALGL